jgi:adenylate cyclase
MEPVLRLHLLAPYLPTDRFRALLRRSVLPAKGIGAAMMVDISGFTPFTMRLVAEYGRQRASEELKRLINPAMELIAGQVFHHGGSVIRFLGDGFTAWFDDAQQAEDGSTLMPGVLRAVAAGIGIQGMSRFFKGFQVRIGVSQGESLRWVVGRPDFGLADVLSGPAVISMARLISEVQPEQVVIHYDAIPTLLNARVGLQITDAGNALITSLPAEISKNARRHKWPAWQAEGDVEEILKEVRPFVDASVREKVEVGVADFGDELRTALPMFMRVIIGPDSDQQAVLDAYVRRVQELLFANGGRMVSVEFSDKGSVVFAVFGAPVTYGDDAQRALRMAFELRQSVVAMPDITSHHIGLSRGLLYTGTVGGEVRHEYSAIGDETNLAARLMTIAQNNQILTTSAVRKQSNQEFIFRELAPLQIKGLAEPLTLYEPTEQHERTKRHQTPRKFVGREMEMAAIERLTALAKNGVASFLQIEGETGIGKSQVLQEAGIRAIENFGFTVAFGRCIHTGREASYLPWRDALISLFQIHDEAASSVKLEIIFEMLDMLLPDARSRFPLIGDVLGVPVDDTPITATLKGLARRQATHALINEIFLRKATRQPILLMIDDLQWIDEVSASLLDDMINRLAMNSAPLLILTAHRPFSQTEKPTTLMDHIAHIHISEYLRLTEINSEAIKPLLESFLNASAPPLLVDYVASRAQGNPFYAQEILTALVEARAVYVNEGRATLLGDLDKVNIGLNVQGLIQARIDRLGELDRLVLKVASVIGAEVPLKLLSKSLPVVMGESELLERLNGLQSRELLYNADSDNITLYQFRHAVVQEVAYQNLPFSQREALHQVVADAIAKDSPEAYDALAYHYSRTQNAEKAWTYLTLAGEKSFNEYANLSALEYYKRALDICNDDEERLQIKDNLVLVYLRLGENAEIAALLPQMDEHAKNLRNPIWETITHLRWAAYYNQISAWADVLREAQEAVSLAEVNAYNRLAWDGYVLMRSAMLNLNQREQVVRSDLDRTMQNLAERLGDRRYIIEMLLTWFDDMYAESHDGAIHGAQTAVAQAHELQNPLLEAQCYEVLGDLYQRDVNFPMALEAYQSQYRLCQVVGDRRHEALTLNRIGYLMTSLGQVTEGHNNLQDAYQILHQIGERSGMATNILYLGISAEYRRAYEEALAFINRSIATYEELKSDFDLAAALFYKGIVLHDKNDLDTAMASLEYAARVISANPRTRYMITQTEVEMAMAMVDFTRGHHITARLRIGPMLLRLQRKQISGLHRPNLAYYWAIQILRSQNENDLANTLLANARALNQPVRRWLEKRDWVTNYFKNIWYHASLF